MNITLTLPSSLEPLIRRRAAEAGMEVATYLAEYIVENLAEEEGPEFVPLSPEEFKVKLREIVDSLPPSSSHVDDSRESIYAGRGE